MSVFLSVLIFILKIILWILAIIILLIAVILLCPIPYRINCVYNDDNKLNANITLSWLWKLVVFRYSYQNDNGNVFFRIGWKKIADSSKTPQHESKGEDIDDEIPNEKNIAKSSDSQRLEKAEAEEESDSASDYQNDNEESENKFSSFFRKIKEAYEHPDRGEIIRESKLFLLRFWRSIKPKEFKLICLVGFDSPDTTGYVLALTGVASAYMKKNHIFKVSGDFEKKVLDINLFTFGKTSLLKLAIPLCRYAFSKPIWKIVKTKLKK